MSSKLQTRILGIAGAICTLAFFAPTVAAKSSQGAISSSNGSVACGVAFTPSYSGGSGTGGWQFCIAGYTNWNGGTTSDVGTEIGSTWSSWTPTAVGSYSFYVVRDEDATYNQSSTAGPYTLTVTAGTQASVSSSSTTVAMGSSFTPSFSGGSGTGGYQFCIAGYTNWNSGATSATGTLIGSTWYSSWTPSAAGTYTFYVIRDEDANYNASSASTGYTLTVVKNAQASISSSNATIAFNGTTQAYPSFTPTYTGGSGSGGWQFCIAGYTNWDSGNSSYTGTNLGTSPGSSGGADWVSSWTPSSPGTYTFYVARDGDGTYYYAGPSSAYTLTVIGPVDGITWNSIGLPSSGAAGQSLSFTASITNSGTTIWNTNYYANLENSSGGWLYTPSISGVSPGSSLTPTFLLTLPSPLATTSYTYTFAALQAGVDWFGSNPTASITVYPLPIITSATSAIGTANTAFTYSVTASNSPTSFSATGLPPGLSINTSTGAISGTPTGAGIWSVTVTASITGGTSVPATVIISVTESPATVLGFSTYTPVSGSSLGFTILRPSP